MTLNVTFCRPVFLSTRNWLAGYFASVAGSSTVTSVQPPVTLQFFPRGVLAMHDERDFDPPQFEQALAAVQGVLDLLPEYLVKQHQGQT